VDNEERKFYSRAGFLDILWYLLLQNPLEKFSQKTYGYVGVVRKLRHALGEEWGLKNL